MLEDGKYRPIFADDRLTRVAREQGKVVDFGLNTVFCWVHLCHPKTGIFDDYEAAWQKLAPGETR